MTDNPLHSLPCDHDAEKAVLACCLKDPASILSEARATIPIDAFHDPHHRTIYATLLTLDNPDVITLNSALADSGELDKAGGFPGVAALLDDVPTTAMFAPYREIILEKYHRRSLIALCEATATACYDNTQDALSIANGLATASHGISERGIKQDSLNQTWQEAISEAFADIEAAHSGEPSPGFHWPLQPLANLTGKVPKGEVVVIAGGTGSGKSSFGLQTIETIAERGTPVGIFSTEMRAKQLAKRSLSQYSGINGQDLIAGRLSATDIPKLQQATKHTSQFPIVADSTPGPTLEYIEARARAWVREHSVEALLIDYLQILTPPKNCWSRENEIASLSHGLLRIAKLLDVAMYVICQTNTPPDKRPGLGSLRESRAIEQDMYGAVIIYPDPEASPGESNVECELIVPKWRDGGSTGAVDCVFRKPYTQFVEAY